MKNLILLALLASLPLVGCSKSESDLTANDKQAMDKLFREGIKNPPSNTSDGKPVEQKPMNAPVDN
jgi:hypothetical protein